MLDMSKRKPDLQIHQEFIKKLKEQAEENDEEIEEEAQWYMDVDEDDGDSYVDWDGY